MNDVGLAVEGVGSSTPDALDLDMEAMIERIAASIDWKEVEAKRLMQEERSYIRAVEAYARDNKWTINQLYRAAVQIHKASVKTLPPHLQPTIGRAVAEASEILWVVKEQAYLYRMC